MRSGVYLITAALTMGAVGSMRGPGPADTSTDSRRRAVESNRDESSARRGAGARERRTGGRCRCESRPSARR